MNKTATIIFFIIVALVTIAIIYSLATTPPTMKIY